MPLCLQLRVNSFPYRMPGIEVLRNLIRGCRSRGSGPPRNRGTPARSRILLEALYPDGFHLLVVLLEELIHKESFAPYGCGRKALGWRFRTQPDPWSRVHGEGRASQILSMAKGLKSHAVTEMSRGASCVW
jgi:hypothetical protein